MVSGLFNFVMKKILALALGLAVILILSGCAGSKKDRSSQGQDNSAQDQNQNTGYIGKMLDVRKKAEQDINNAVNQEDNRINETAGD
jgi:protein involved in sex pheromone biosynthesis